MPKFTGTYDCFKELKLNFAYVAVYEIGDALTWQALVYLGRDLIGQPTGQIDLSKLPPESHRTAVTIAVTASIENAISLNK